MLRFLKTAKLIAYRKLKFNFRLVVGRTQTVIRPSVPRLLESRRSLPKLFSLICLYF